MTGHDLAPLKREIARSGGGLAMLLIDRSAALAGYTPRGANTDPAPIEWR